MSIIKNFPFADMLSLTDDLPLWVLQGFYVELSEQLKAKGSTMYVNRPERSDMIQLFVPIVSKIGRQYLSSSEDAVNTGKLQLDEMIFLQSAMESQNIIDIAISNDWTLKKVSKILVDCLNSNLIEPNCSQAVYSTAMFLSGQIKIGELLIRRHKITDSQLERALKAQSDNEEAFDERVKIAEILINMGFLKKEDVEDFITLKEVAPLPVEIKDITAPLKDQIKELMQANTEYESKCYDLTKRAEIAEQEKNLAQNRAQDLQQKVEILKAELEAKEKENKSLFKKL